MTVADTTPLDTNPLTTLPNTDDPETLDLLAIKANHFHQQYREKSLTFLQIAKVAGDALRAAKLKIRTELGPRQWHNWLRRHFHASAATARDYMFVSKHWEELSEILDQRPRLSINEAKRYIRKSNPKINPKIKSKGPRPTGLLAVLQAVSPGLAQREFIEQSSEFVFRDGKVYTFNDEVYCSAPCPEAAQQVVGAVPAQPLLDLLRKCCGNPVKVGERSGELVVSGSPLRAGLPLDKGIVLPIDSVPNPSDWKPLPPQFLEAVVAVQDCAGRDDSQFVLTCLHWHPEWIQACDNHQICRYSFTSEISRPVLLRMEAVKYVVGLGVTEFTETDGWVHFRNAAGVVLACRRYLEDYHDLTDLLAVQGDPIAFPAALTKLAKCGQVFTQDNQADGAVLLEIENGAAWIKGEGTHGWVSESVEIAYEGPKRSFYVQPRIFTEVQNRTRGRAEATLIINADRLKLEDGPLMYVAHLVPADNEGELTGYGLRPLTSEEEERRQRVISLLATMAKRNISKWPSAVLDHFVIHRGQLASLFSTLLDQAQQLVSVAPSQPSE